MTSAKRLARAVLARGARLLVVMFAVTLFTFLLVRMLPGSPEDILVPASDDTDNPQTNAVVKAQKQQVRKDLELDKPLPVQYLGWLGGLVTGDLGYEYSVLSRQPVSTRVKHALPSSIQLIIYSQILALGLAIPTGVTAAYGHSGVASDRRWVKKLGRGFDRFSNASAFGMLSIPNFALALLLAYWVGVRLDPNLPAAINIPPLGAKPFPPLRSLFSQSALDHFFSMLLPALSLAIGQSAVYMRLLRSDLIQTLQEDFVLMAKAKGASPRRVLWRHALRPSSLTLVTVAGLQIGSLLGSAVVIEVLFNIDGMGKLMFESILSGQYLMLQSCVAIIAIAFVLINTGLDFIYATLDPRIRRAA